MIYNQGNLVSSFRDLVMNSENDEGIVRAEDHRTRFWMHVYFFSIFNLMGPPSNNSGPPFFVTLRHCLYSMLFDKGLINASLTPPTPHSPLKVASQPPEIQTQRKGRREGKHWISGKLTFKPLCERCLISMLCPPPSHPLALYKKK